MAHHFLAQPRSTALFVFVAGPAADSGLALELAAGWARATGEETVLVDAGPAAVEAEAAPGVRRRAPGDREQPGEGTVFWRLGNPSPGQLDDLAAVARVPGGRLPGADRRRRILWCLDSAEAGRWRPLSALGHLAEILDAEGVALVAGDGLPDPLADLLRERAGVATGRGTGLVALADAARPGARAAALARLPALLDTTP